jgi:hypothetical protein
MQNVCKSLGAEIGDLIERNLRTKYLVELCESSTLEKYRSKLQEAELKIKSLEKFRMEPTINSEVNEYKVQLYDKMEEINKLTCRLHEKEGQSSHVAELEEKNKVINDLKNQLASQDVIIKHLHEEKGAFNNDNLGSGSNQGNSELLSDDFVHMQIIDPTGHSKLFPDVEVDSEVVERFFDKWKNDQTMAEFVREKDGRCSWCLYPWGPESISMLGTCGHIWHHACLFKWLKRSRKCWCRTPFHEREYEQRGLLNQMPPMETQQNTDEMTEETLAQTQIDSTPIDHFTINEYNLSDGEFDRLLLSGRFNEWKEYALANQPTIHEQNMQRSIRRHRRRQQQQELNVERNNIINKTK